MAEPTPGTQHSITITSLRDEAKINVARILAAAARTDQTERILKRLDALPWTVTRSASAQTAKRLVAELEKKGAVVEVFPPLPTEPQAVRPIAPEVRSEWMSAEEREPAEPPGAGDVPIIDLEPLTLGGILDRGFTLCRNYFWKLFAIAVIPLVVTLGVLLGAGLILLLAGLTSWAALGEKSVYFLIIMGIAILIPVAIILILVTYLAQGALIYAVSQVYLGRKIVIRDAYGFVFDRLGRFILTTILFGLASFATLIFAMFLGSLLFFGFREMTGSGLWSIPIWLLLLMIPTYAIPKWFLFDKVVIIEDQAYVDALRRSWELVSGKADATWLKWYWLRLVVLFHVFFFIVISVKLLVLPISIILTAPLPETLKFVGIGLSNLVSTFGDVVWGLYVSVCLVIFYYDIRIRKEGFDLQMLAGLNRQQE